MKKLLIMVPACAAALVGGAALVASQGKEMPLTPQQERYCDGVRKWRMEEVLGVKPSVRLGRPDTQGTYDTWCLRN